MVSIQSVLRPRGPTLNFALESKQLRSIQQEPTLLNGSSLTAKLGIAESPSSSSAPLAALPTPAALSVEIPTPPAALTEERPSPPAQEFSPSLPASSVIEIRQPETSPKPTKRPITNGTREEFSTPPSGVTILVGESPAKSTRMMTRKEALKVIAAVPLPSQITVQPEQSFIPSEPNQPEDKASPSRKRPHEDSKPKVHEKVSFHISFLSKLAYETFTSLFR